MTAASMSSPFAARIEGYIAYKQGLGYVASDARSRGSSLDRFCREKYPDKAVFDKELAYAWVRAVESAHTRAKRATFARQFASYLVEELGEEAFVLPHKVSPATPSPKAPHLFTEKELDAFFGAADVMEPSPKARARHLVAPVFFRVLRCCGLRPKEARDLKVGDFDLGAGVIHVVGSKGARDRDVVVRDDVRMLCVAYSAEVEKVFPGREMFFPGSRGGAWSRQAMLNCFHKCWEDAGVTEFEGEAPVPYSFRHTFATTTISRWRAEGVDVHANLRFLQEYMGHVVMASTLYYLHLVRGGLGDPTSVPTWSPSNRMEEGGYYYVEA